LAGAYLEFASGYEDARRLRTGIRRPFRHLQCSGDLVLSKQDLFQIQIVRFIIWPQVDRLLESVYGGFRLAQFLIAPAKEVEYFSSRVSGRDELEQGLFALLKLVRVILNCG
jgi:hypothetical protein